MSVAVTELIDLHRITEGLLFDTEVVAGPDNFGHAAVRQLHNMLCASCTEMHTACYATSTYSLRPEGASDARISAICCQDNFRW